MNRNLLSSALVVLLSSSGVAFANSDWSANATDRAGDRERTFTYECPPNGTLSSAIYGTDVYTTDSAVCVAAVHAGVITPRDGGQVRIRIIAGAADYDGTQRNGVASNRWGSYASSFVFEGGGGAPARVVDASWGTTAQEYRGDTGSVITFRCPGNGSTGAAVYGTRLYTTDSAVCVAAVHAGRITATSGGEVTVQIKKGAPSYQGTTNNGVTTRGWGSYDASYELR